MPYWELHAHFQAAVDDYLGVWQGPDKEHSARIPSKAQADALARKLPPGTPAQIVDIETVSIKAPLLFSLNDLQKEANRRLGLTAQQTLDTAQSLYDQHLTSYPRTEVAQTVASQLQALTVGSAALWTQAIQELRQPLPRIVHDTAVAKASHYAIIPTGHAPTQALSERDQAVYDLICQGFLPPGQDERTTVWTRAVGERFKVTGTVTIDPGWRAALDAAKNKPEAEGDDEAELESAIAPGLQKGPAITVMDTTIHERATKPPARLTDASLLVLMEKYRLGTLATRARTWKCCWPENTFTARKRRWFRLTKANICCACCRRRCSRPT